MGNRAVITVGNAAGHFNRSGLGIYLHWNGGRDSVEAFLKYCEMHDMTAPSQDPEGLGNLFTVINNFFGGSSCFIGIVGSMDCDNGDNGVYCIQGWEIVGRKYFDGIEQHQYDMEEMLLAIDEKQPAQMQIGEYIAAEPVNVEDIRLGDEIVQINWRGEVVKSTVIGFGEDRCVNGHDVKGIPYTDMFSNHPEDNPNNYLYPEWYGKKKEYRRVRHEESDICQDL